MRILYDYQIFDTQITGGISRYHADLYRGCLDNSIDTDIAIKYSDNLYLQELGMNLENGFSADQHFLCKRGFEGKYQLFRLAQKMGIDIKSSKQLNAMYCRQIIQEGRYDIFHPTYYDDTYSDINIKSPTVVTIHDMIYEDFPQFPNNISVIERKKKWLERSHAIIAISNFTKERLLHYYENISESKIHTVYHGIDLNNLGSFSTNTAKGSYILYVGERWGYKDFYTLLRALKIFSERNKDIKLYCTGSPFNHNELLFIDFLGLQNIVYHVGRVFDKHLVELYQKAQAFVSTSLSEGFGLPLLECMKYGTPMILSDIPVYREVADDCAVYFKASDEYSLAESITEVVGNSNLQQQLVAKGRNRLTLFDKQSMIRNSINVYNSL